MKPHRVIYLLKVFPKFSETFVLGEILGLQSLGVDVTVVSLLAPTEGIYHAGVANVRNPVVQAPQYLLSQFPAFASACMWAVRDRPVRFAATCARALLGMSPDGFKRWLQAVWLCREFAGCPERHVHCHFMEGAAHAGYFLNMLNGNPCTVTVHAFEIFQLDSDWDRIRRIAARASGIVTVCDFNLRYLAERLGPALARKVRRIYNGVDLIKFTPPPMEQREPGTILFVGRLIEKKGVAVLLNALALLKGRGIRVRCAIAGDGLRGPLLRRQARQLGLGDGVRFLGAVNQPRVLALLQSATLLVAPCLEARDGDRDALPTVLLEALACGTPIVTTPVTGIPEIVRDGVEGIIVPPGDPAATADAIGRLLADPGLRSEMSCNARRRAEELFDSRRQVAELAGFLHGIGKAPMTE